MMAVMLSGFVGRYLFVRIPKTIRGVELTHGEIRTRAEELKNEIGAASLRPGMQDRLREVEDELEPASGRAVVGPIMVRRRLRRLRGELLEAGVDRPLAARATAAMAERALLLRRLAYLDRRKRLFAMWHVFHQPLVYVMFAIAALARRARGLYGVRMALARHTLIAWLAAAAAALFAAVPASAQIGQLLSPGPLSRAHASLEGADKCQKCHEPGRKVTPALCLSCHKPVAERIQAKRGVHRDVTGDCASCHVEHAGVDAELRPFDPASFDHAVETGFPLDGRHAAVAKNCARCHKTRSFLARDPGLQHLPHRHSQAEPRVRLPRVPLDGRRVQGRPHGVRSLEGRLPAHRRPSRRRVREMSREPGASRA